MDIIGHNKLDPCLLRKLDLSLVYKLLNSFFAFLSGLIARVGI